MLKTNSKEIKENDIFIAIKGDKYDGHDYIEEAIKNGAVKIIAEKGKYSVETEIVPSTKEYLKKYIEKYKEEIKDIHLIGMTGTNGKTTTCYLIYQALNRIGKKCAYIGTIGFYIDGKIKDLKNTTPGILELYEMIIEAKNKGCSYVAMEVSSHSLAQERVYGLEFDVAIISNITQDHLDYHKTMEEYAKTKSKLFDMVKSNGYTIIPNEIDYKDYIYLEKNKNITYGENGDYILSDIIVEDSKTLFKLANIQYETSLFGKYNIYNIINVIIILNQLNIGNIPEIIKGLTPPPGRMDMIDKGFKIIIDYAHTPDAVKNILMCVNEMATGNIYVIIGCGGNRDKTKRPIMAQIATSYSTKAIFTSDNPRNENADDIINDMIRDLSNNNYEIETNRKKAILKGIQKCQKGDILLILGKGHENYQIIGNERIHFDDKEIVLEYFRR